MKLSTFGCAALTAGILAACGDGGKQTQNLADYQAQEGVASPAAEQHARLCNLSENLNDGTVSKWLQRLINEGRAQIEKLADITPSVNVLTIPDVDIRVTFNDDELKIDGKTVGDVTYNGVNYSVSTRISKVLREKMQVINGQWQQEAAEARGDMYLDCDDYGSIVVTVPPVKEEEKPANLEPDFRG